MEQIRYYPLIDNDNSGLDKSPMFFTDDIETITANHKFYLTEFISQHYRLMAREPQEDENFKIRCPYCGKAMSKIASSISKHKLGLYTCNECREENKI